MWQQVAIGISTINVAASSLRYFCEVCLLFVYSESASINSGIPSSDKLIKRPTKDRKTEELDPHITHTTTSSDTTSTKGKINFTHS